MKIELVKTLAEPEDRRTVWSREDAPELFDELHLVGDTDIDRAARRILTARMRLGIYDDPAHNPYNALDPAIVGSEKQSEELVNYLLKEFEEEPSKIWESNIFGKSLHELVNEGLRSKLCRMPTEARMKLQETLERIINEGCGGLICFIL